MGFFSFNCQHCRQSLKAPYDQSDRTAWQNDVVVADLDSGTVIRGSYDGYGNVAGWEVTDLEDTAGFWHADCYALATPHQRRSRRDVGYARDQGFFYDDHEVLSEAPLERVDNLDSPLNQSPKSL